MTDREAIERAEIDKALDGLVDRRSDHHWSVSMSAQEDIAELMHEREAVLRARIESTLADGRDRVREVQAANATLRAEVEMLREVNRAAAHYRAVENLWWEFQNHDEAGNLDQLYVNEEDAEGRGACLQGELKAAEADLDYFIAALAAAEGEKGT